MKFIFFFILWIFFATFSLNFGHFDLKFSEILQLLFGLDFEYDISNLETTKNIIFDIRLPRVLMSSLCGGILALCGIALQGLFKNPLVEPKIIGISTGAAFGGCVAILLGFSGILLSFFAFIFGIFALLALLFIANFIKQKSTLTLILAGIIINGFFAALISLVQYLSDDEETLPNIVFWLMGSFVNSSLDKLTMICIIAIPCLIILLKMSWRFNLLSLGETELKAMKINVKFTRILILALCTLLISSQVSLSGNIGWIGLIIPHIARILIGANHSKNMPLCFVLGMIFMLGIDNAARTLSSSEIPIGILSALIGTPIFAYLIKRNLGAKG